MLEKWNQAELLHFEGLLALKVHVLGNVHKPSSTPTTIYLVSLSCITPSPHA